MRLSAQLARRMDTLLQSKHFLLSDVVCRNKYKKATFAKSIGGKATGLCATPRHLVPPFFVISPDLCPYEQFSERINKNKMFIDFISDIQQHSNRVYIRSSAQNEHLAERGRFRSAICEASLADIHATLQALLKHPTEAHSTPQAPESHPAYLIQPYIKWHKKGHLSNERRICKKSEQWCNEYYSKNTSKHHTEWFSIKPHKESRLEPRCSNHTELVKALKEIAERYSNIPGKRFHFEWVWDSNNLWIVQKDIEYYPCSGKKPSLCVGKFDFPTSIQLNVFVPFKTQKTKWPKLSALTTFHKCGAILLPFFLLFDQESIQKLYVGNSNSLLEKDLSTLTRHPLVIRADIKGNNGNPSLLLPRSGLLCNRHDALRFLKAATQQLYLSGHKSEDICFIAHHYIPASSSTLAYSSPTTQNILLHSAWGMPDGLLYQGYDTTLMESKGNAFKIIKQTIRFKDQYINANHLGEWTNCKVEAPWDWQSSIQESDALTVAQYTHNVTSRLRKSIVVMFLVDLPEYLGVGNVLPWFYTYSPHPTNSINLQNPNRGRKTQIHISNNHDVYKLNQLSDLSCQKYSILLKPNAKLIRSATLLEELIDIVLKKNIEVYLEGSFLSHTYYILKRKNVLVRTLNG